MSILTCNDINLEHLRILLGTASMQLKHVSHSEKIPGSFWKDSEAGLIGNTLYIRNDTPVHSALHETCHYICMDDERKQKLDTNAGGDYAEEDAVCYLQILLSKQIPEMGQARMFSDMDEWGYSFRLGSAQKWFEQDAEDAYSWLQHKKLLPQ